MAGTHAHILSVLFTVSSLLLTESDYSESPPGMGMVRGTHPLTHGSKEVEGWRGQAIWPGKGLKKKEGGHCGSLE